MSHNTIHKLTKIAARSLAATVLLVASGAIAQQPQAPRPAPSAQRPAPAQRPAQPAHVQCRYPKPSKPRLKTKRSWKYRSARPRLTAIGCCNARPPATPPAAEVCDMAQVTQVQGRNVPFSRIAVAHTEKNQPFKLVVQVPVNASFGTNVRIQTSDEDPGIEAPFTNCTPNGCFAEFELKEEILKKTARGGRRRQGFVCRCGRAPGCGADFLQWLRPSLRRSRQEVKPAPIGA